ncbi:MAG TPA: hypothetical protein VMF32_01180 [Xanthobacteraceae bacterium]|nr:hypothetical protein [Xanthobacteraceae bacterium]
MVSHLYRFRPTNAVLDQYEELAKQEIYFSPPEELNDPMEGYLPRKDAPVPRRRKGAY